MAAGFENGDRQEGARTASGGMGAQGAQGAQQDWDALKEDVSGMASEVAGAATERGRQFINSARDQAAGYVDRRKDSAAQSVEDIAHSLRDSGKAFDDRPNIRAFVDSAADGLEELASQIRSRSFADMYSDIEGMARRHPTTFAAAATVAGFLFARFLKSSAADLRDQEHRRREGQRAGMSAERPSAYRPPQPPGTTASTVGTAGA